MTVLLCSRVYGQESLYQLDASQVKKEVQMVDLGFKGNGPAGETLGVNNLYFKKNGEPWFPLMGEFHYIRYPEAYWEEEILKMKSAGLQIVATYVFWNAHETSPDRWDWSGIKDLRHFVDLCAKHDMYVWLRIGPWCHGEQVHGGHPDWINNMKGKRSNAPAYLAESRKLFHQIADQVEGQWFEEGGPIIGLQLENEYASGDSEHIRELKKISVEVGMKPVYYTVTANTVFDDSKTEVIPLQGSYPYRGWEKGGGKATKDFLYGNDQWIMTDALGKVYYDVHKYPKGLCEQGCGSQMTFRNRFAVEPHVVEAHLQNQIGRGMNLVGYYMFQGGTQLPGLKEPGYPESYDFQAPLGEFGQVRESYKYLKTLHHFVNSFGSDLAKMQVVEPEDPVRDELETDRLRYVARTNGKSGFVFWGNTQVRVPMPEKQFQLKLKLADEVLVFPEKELTLRGETTAILPFNMDLNGPLLKYATAQPLAKINYKDVPYYFFYQVNGMDVELAFDALSIASVEGDNWTKEMVDGQVLMQQRTSKARKIDLQSKNGEKAVLVMLSREEAENTWVAEIDGQERVIVSTSDLLFDQDKIICNSWGTSQIDLKVFPFNGSVKSKNGQLNRIGGDGVFQEFSISLPEAYPKPKIKRLSNSKWEVELDKELPNQLSDLFMELDYQGGMAKVSRENKVLTDNLYNGEPWEIGLKRYMNKEPVKLQMEAFPWSDEISGVERPKSSLPEIKRIRFIPVYTTEINLNK
ncbi:beta-galactosidase [Echinicola shivajiensis]|uniref:beta-galactosidase n=1 Tax=Echinicola shivajiensis TaxID=1035916 RepID=UPI001BFC975F|nr:beta-galactosidase [Echinicola shivajiensis]